MKRLTGFFVLFTVGFVIGTLIFTKASLLQVLPAFLIGGALGFYIEAQYTMRETEARFREKAQYDTEVAYLNGRYIALASKLEEARETISNLRGASEGDINARLTTRQEIVGNYYQPDGMLRD